MVSVQSKSSTFRKNRYNRFKKSKLFENLLTGNSFLWKDNEKENQKNDIMVFDNWRSPSLPSKSPKYTSENKKPVKFKWLTKGMFKWPATKIIPSYTFPDK